MQSSGFQTTLSVEALIETLRDIETACGRGPADPRWGPRAIDLDLLLFGERGRRRRGLYAAPAGSAATRYMLGPLAELAPQLRYPPDGPSIAELWDRFPDAPAGLRPHRARSGGRVSAHNGLTRRCCVLRRSREPVR